MFPRLSLLLALAAPLAAAAAPPLAYTQAVTDIDRLYLYPDQLDAPQLLFSAARGLSQEIDWLLAEQKDGVVYLSHGDGTELGSVSVASVDTLPHALASLEDLVLEAGYDVGDADVRLGLLDGMTHALDRYSRVLAGDRLSRFEVRLRGVLVGIGVTFRVEEAGARVRRLVDGGPAAGVGLHVDDLIVSVDGVSVRNMSSDDISARIRGEEGSSVLVGVSREGQLLEFSIERAEVPVPNVHHEVLADQVGYVRIDHFSQRTVEHLRASMDALRADGALRHGLIIDLRGNTGGSMKEAARSADQFLTEGLLLRTAGRDGGRVQNLQEEMTAVDAGDEPQIPVVVLMDRKTASGSEILAGALLAHHRAGLVGTRSYGKGSVQKIYSLRDGLRLKLTVARYLLAGDLSVADTGLLPDVAVGDVILSTGGAHYRYWSEDDAGQPWDRIVPAVDERTGWRGAQVETRDTARELARRAVLRAYSWEREPVVAALRQVAEEIRAEEDARLVEAYAARSIDWTPAPAEPDRLGRPMTQVELTTVPGAQPDTYVLSAQVHNDGPTPLHRALVELSCDSFGYWDGLVLPVGLVPPGETRTASVEVTLRPGYPLRQDEVALLLRADRRPAANVGTALIDAHSRLPPELSASLVLGGEGEARVATVELHNRSSAELTDVELSFAAPGDLHVELVESSRTVERLGPDATATVELGLLLGEDLPDDLPLQLRVEADDYQRIASWDLALPRAGTPVVLHPPVIGGLDRTSAPVGPTTLRFSATDTGPIDHMVVYADRDKIAWAPGVDHTVQLDAPVSLHAGENTFTVIVEDVDGLRQVEHFAVRGYDETATVDAQ